MSKNEAGPEDPMEMVAVAVPGGNLEDTLDAVVREFILMGWRPPQILALFRSPRYGMTHQIYLAKGHDHVKARIDTLAQAWQAGWLTGGEAHG